MRFENTNDLNNILTEDITYILDALHGFGKGYLVGGCLRDYILGITPHDYDFTTNLPIDKLLEIFDKYEPKVVSEEYQVVSFILNNSTYNIARMRKDILSHNRKFTEIEFVNDINEDLPRRDFTINALAYDGTEVYYVDNLLSDIDNKTLRFVGDPATRIKEDPLRMIRGVRFVTNNKLSEIEPKSLAAMQENAHLINNISIDLVRAEFDKILLGPDPVQGVRLLHETGLLTHIIPELEKCIGFAQHNYHHDTDVFEHTMRVLYHTRIYNNNEQDLAFRLSALLHDIAKPYTCVMKDGMTFFFGHEIVSGELAEVILKRLHYNKKIIKEACNLISSHLAYHRIITEEKAINLINKIGVDNLYKLECLIRADILGCKGTPDYTNLIESKKVLNKVIAEHNMTNKK